MRLFACLLVLSSLVSVTNAQDSLQLRLQRDFEQGDSVLVAIHLAEAGDSLSIPIKAFEIVLEMPEGWSMKSSSSEYTLSGVKGWTTAINADRGWIGGFSSSLDAIKTGGVLVSVLLTRHEGTESVPCIRSSRLNSGSPYSMLDNSCLVP